MKAQIYKYSHANEWLNEKLQQFAQDSDTAKLLSFAVSMAAHFDGDMIQEEFESEMDADGFFTPEPQFDRYTSIAHPGEVFTLEARLDGEYQTIYPSAMSNYGAVYETEQEAWAAIKDDCSKLGITLTKC